MTRRLPILLALLLASALSTLPAQAGVFDGDAMNAVTTLRKENDARLGKLEEAAQNQMEVANQMEGLKSEVARLRGQVEMLTFDLGQAQKRIQDYYVDLDARLRRQETSVAESASKPAAPAAVNPAAETQAFEAALNLFKGGKFREAAEAFRSFIAAYPAGAFAPNAHYWAANAYFQLHDWAKAVEFYTVIGQKWPADPKAPDAMLKLAEAHREGGNAKIAQETLEDLIARYPDSPAAATARQRLSSPFKRKGN